MTHAPAANLRRSVHLRLEAPAQFVGAQTQLSEVARFCDSSLCLPSVGLIVPSRSTGGSLFNASRRAISELSLHAQPSTLTRAASASETRMKARIAAIVYQLLAEASEAAVDTPSRQGLQTADGREQDQSLLLLDLTVARERESNCTNQSLQKQRFLRLPVSRRHPGSFGIPRPHREPTKTFLRAVDL